MNLLIILASIAILLFAGLMSVLLTKYRRAALLCGSVGGLLACLVGGGASLGALLNGAAMQSASLWPLPVGGLLIGIDALTAFFLLCVFLVSGLAMLYGLGYLSPLTRQRSLASPVALMNLLVASMVTLVIARNGILFFAAWELMSLVSFFLVLFDGEHAETRHAALVYLIASHLGALPLLVFFLLLSGPGGSFDFATLAANGTSSGLANTCFVLALVGFGTKAGFWPLHVWLPKAHPAAPSHVSAVMSGVMIKMGIYGLIRAITLLGAPPAWWGITVIIIGAVSGVAGVLHALAQHDLKRLLAYHSVENIGIIALGIGLGLLGQTYNQPTVAFLGYAGGVLHVLNHGLFKGLLFQGAGSVQHGAGTRNIDSLGGLARRMPTTSLTFLVGSTAISGLPPLNGFVSELLIYAGAFLGAAHLPSSSAGWALAVIPSLALIGGLATACFVKAYGMVFLGEPRTEAAQHAHESGFLMRAAMLIGAALCVTLGVWPTLALRLISGVGVELTGMATPPLVVSELLVGLMCASLIFIIIIIGLALMRCVLLRRREVRSDVTWGCGYEAPTPRMQYTAASFARPLLGPFRGLFSRSVHRTKPSGYFPTAAAYDEHLTDRADQVFDPLARGFVWAMTSARRLERGGTQRYLAYVLVTLVALLLWQLAMV